MIRRINTVSGWDAKLPARAWNRNRIWSLSNLNALSKSRFVNNAYSGLWSISRPGTENWSQQL